MAKLKLPLLSKSAHGQFGKKLNYYTKAGKTYTRKFHYPKRPPTGAQLSRRYITGLLTIRWQTMTEDERLSYKQGAELESKKTGLGISGFNYFVKVASKDLLTHYKMRFLYLMNEGSGQVVKDLSGNGLNLTLGSVAPATLPVWEKSDNPLFGTCLSSNGDRKGAQSGLSNLFDYTTNFTYFARVRFDAKDSIQRFILYSGARYGIYKQTDNSIVVYLRIGGVDRSLNLPASEWEPGVPFTIAMSFDNSLVKNSMKLYLNGKFYSQRTLNGDGALSNYSLFLLCYNGLARPTIGAIDNVLGVARTIGPNEIKKIHDLMSEPKQRQKYFK